MTRLTAALAALLIPGAVLAQDAPVLPKTLAWTTHDVGTAGYAQTIAIGKALQDAYGTQLRALAMSTDQSRLAPARDGRVPYALSGTDTFYAFEGVQSYAAPGWGPQEIAAVAIIGAQQCAAFGVAADSGITTMADVKGKRVGRVVGSLALQANVRAFLAFGGLTEADVEMVDMPSYAAAWQALTNGQIDGNTALTSGAVLEQAAAGPRGLYWVPMPLDDDAAWARTQAVNPHFTRTTGTLGPNIPAEGLACAGVPYPVLIGYAKDADLDYNVLKAVVTQTDKFKSAEPSASGWAADKQVFGWVIPFSEGAIRYWKEIGLWDEEKQAHNDALLKRQQVMLEAWKQMDGVAEDGFGAKWLDVRAKALTEAGFNPYFTN
jgi:TRAP transporter TAXI family solute receptor